jgi:hypothetical protein
MMPGRRHQGGEPAQQLCGPQHKHLTTVGQRPLEPVHEAPVVQPGQPLKPANSAMPFSRKRRARSVAAEPLQALPVIGVQEVLLVVDATNGQNAIAQARQFHEALGVTGFLLTKLDGTAEGGVIIGICDELKIPVRYVGIGEKVADLKPFDPHEFVEALFD